MSEIGPDEITPGAELVSGAKRVFGIKNDKQLGEHLGFSRQSVMQLKNSKSTTIIYRLAKSLLDELERVKGI
jgi:hypothetical protein